VCVCHRLCVCVCHRLRSMVYTHTHAEKYTHSLTNCDMKSKAQNLDPEALSRSRSLALLYTYVRTICMCICVCRFTHISRHARIHTRTDEHIHTHTGMPGVSILRLVRVFRVVRLFKRLESLRIIGVCVCVRERERVCV